MRAADKRLSSKPASATVFLSALLAALSPTPVAGAGQSESKPAELAKVRSIAESQHEIVMLLLDKKEFAQALAEANKIFDMNWPDDHEPMLLKELMKLADRFLHQEPSFGLQLLENNQRRFKAVSSQIAIWKEKGYLFKKMNQTDKALDCFNQALRLEKSHSR